MLIYRMWNAQTAIKIKKNTQKMARIRQRKQNEPYFYCSPS